MVSGKSAQCIGNVPAPPAPVVVMVMVMRTVPHWFHVPMPLTNCTPEWGEGRADQIIGEWFTACALTKCSPLLPRLHSALAQHLP